MTNINFVILQSVSSVIFFKYSFLLELFCSGIYRHVLIAYVSDILSTPSSAHAVD